jgi:hypothetical protein
MIHLLNLGLNSYDARPDPVISCFINPLGRALFAMDLTQKTNVTVLRVVEGVNRMVSLELG